MNLRFDFKLFADYYQFYLQDEAATGDLSESWTDEAVNRLLATAPGVIGVGTVRNMDVPVVIEIADSEPSEDLANWDQVNECSLEVNSGRIVVAGCTDYFPDAARIEVQPGTYRAQIYYGKLGSLSADALSGEDNYKVLLWRAAAVPTRVIKQRSGKSGN